MTHPDTLTIHRAVVEQALAEFELLLDFAAAYNKPRIIGAYSALRAALQPQAARCPLCNYNHGHAIGCENNPVDIALKAQAAAEPVLWQYRWTNPAGDNQPASMMEWKDVVPAWNQTMQDKITDLIAYRYNGNPTYEVRGLYAAPPATQAARTVTDDGYGNFIIKPPLEG